MKKMIKAAEGDFGNLSLSDVRSTLWRNVGSRLDAMDGFIVNLGDGGAYIVYEDSNSGEVQGVRVDISPSNNSHFDSDEVINYVLSTWDK